MLRRSFLAPTLIAATWLAVVSMGLPAPAKSNDGPKVFRTTCIACHSVTPDGRMPRLEGLRATPEEWDHVLRRMGRHGLALSEAEHKATVKEISRTQSLSPDENAAIGYLAVSPAANLSELVPNHGTFRQTCVSCHSFAKIASFRRTPENWAYMRDFHLGMFPAPLTQSFRELFWQDTAKEATAYLAKRFPMETPEWRRWKAEMKPLAATGPWVVVGHEPGAGDYEALLTFKAKGDDDYSLVRRVRYESGRTVTQEGTATLFGGGALRCEWLDAGRKIKASYTIAPAGVGLLGRRIELLGSWEAFHAVHRYGTETGSRLRNAAATPEVLRVTPSWIRPGQGRVEIVATTDGPAVSSWQPKPSDPAIKVVASRLVDDHHVAFTLDVGPQAHLGQLSLGLGGKAEQPSDRLVVANGIDYIKITPEKAVARLGGVTVPPDGVPFEAIAYSNGPDGKRHTKDDLPLGVVPASWSITQYFATFEDDDVSRVGRIGSDGLFMPADEEADPKAYTYGKNGRVWVVGTYQPKNGAALQARAFLNVTAPDLVKTIR